jgi:cysteine desulfurase
MMRVYLDHNATCPLRPFVADALGPLLSGVHGNPSSIHREGRAARALVEQARRAVRDALGVRRGTVVFTGSATEANHLAVDACAGRVALATTQTEHPSLREVLTRRARGGAHVTWMSVDGSGHVTEEALISAADAGSGIFLTLANNELGTILDVAQIAAACEARGVWLHLDAAQWFGRWRLALPSGVSSVTVSAHKAGGLAGVGALWIDPVERLAPLLVGGSQERGRRAGTENLLGIASLATVAGAPETDAWTAAAAARDEVERGLADAGWVTVGAERERMTNTSCVARAGRSAEELVMALDLAGIAVSAGAACTAGSIETSPVLRAIGVDERTARGAIRLSFGPWSTAVEPLEILDRILRATA